MADNEILKGIASSNFYLKFDLPGDPRAILFAVDESGICHICPSQGQLRFECGNGASAQQVYGVSSDLCGVISVHTGTGDQRLYSVHQTQETMTDLSSTQWAVSEYQNLQSKR